MTNLTAAMALAFVAGLFVSADYAVNALNVSPWMLETFAVHPDCPDMRC